MQIRTSATLLQTIIILMKTIYLLMLALTLQFTICKATTVRDRQNNIAGFKNDASIEKFWTWFKKNEKQLRRFEENPDKYLTEILEEVKKIKPGLAIEFEPPKNGIINMTVSADGDITLFDIVRNIIAKAPTIKGWKFLAFRQRMPLEQIKEMKLKAQNHELDPTRMKFFPVVSGDSLDIIIYAEGITEDNFNQVAYGGLLLLDNLLGEYDCVTKVRNYDFQNIPAKKEELEGLLPLLDIAAYVDKFHSSKRQ